MIKKIKNLLEFGIHNFLKRLYFLLQFKINKMSKVSYCRSYYSPFFLSNYGDKTFKYYITGTYGNYFSDLLKNDSSIDVFFDIGANQGLYTIIAAHNKDIHKVYSFEPNKKIFDFLSANSSYNACSTNVELFNLGISNETGFVDLSILLNHSGAGEIINRIDQQKNSFSHSVERVQVVGYEWLNEKIDVKKNDKIGVKIDVEGHEYSVLETLTKAKMWENIVWIFFEINPLKLDLELTLNLMKNNGFYEVKRIYKDDIQFDILMKR